MAATCHPRLGGCLLQGGGGRRIHMPEDFSYTCWFTMPPVATVFKGSVPIPGSYKKTGLPKNKPVMYQIGNQINTAQSQRACEIRIAPNFSGKKRYARPQIKPATAAAIISMKLNFDTCTRL